MTRAVPGLRHRIKVEQATVSKATDGGGVNSWATFVEDEPAAVVPLKGREFFAAQQINADAPYKIVVRYRPDKIYAPLTMRVIWEGRILDIEAVAEQEARGRLVELMCRERAPSGYRDG